MKYENIYWHDGNIKEMQYRFPLSRHGRSVIEMDLELYSDCNAEIPSDFKALFPNVTEICKSVDFNEIKDNVVAGSIQWVEQTEVIAEDKKSYVYSIILHGGKVVIHSGQIKIKKNRTSALTFRGRSEAEIISGGNNEVVHNAQFSCLTLDRRR